MILTQYWNYQGCSLCQPLKLKTEEDNTNVVLENSQYLAKTESNYCFIMYSKTSKEQHFKLK